jgi:hypothetical protein
MVALLDPEPDVQEQLVDDYLETRQYEEGGLLGTITHLGDGEVPQDCSAMVGSLQLPKSNFEELLERYAGAQEGSVAATEGEQVALSPELRDLAESLLRLLGPTAEAAVQTGGVKDAGRVVRGGP